MKVSNARRRLLAAFSAVGVAGIVGLRPAKAAVRPCTSSRQTGNEENGEPNYSVEANSGDYAFLTPIEAIGEEIVIYNAENGTGRKTATAAVKGRMIRGEDGVIGASSVTFEFPLTALFRDGNFYGIVQMAYDQNVTIGLNFTSGIATVGGFTFEKQAFSANSTNQGFEGNAAQTLYSALTANIPFRIELMSGGTAYSAITVDTVAFRAFIEDTVIAEMERMKEMDATSPCAALEDFFFDDDEDLGCFLTSACCTVVGLPDDCWELATLRYFRDGWMSKFEAGRKDIQRYYQEAPAVARRLLGSEAGRRQLLGLYWGVIVPSAIAARLGLNRLAYRLYRRMMVELLPA